MTCGAGCPNRLPDTGLGYRQHRLHCIQKSGRGRGFAAVVRNQQKVSTQVSAARQQGFLLLTLDVAHQQGDTPAGRVVRGRDVRLVGSLCRAGNAQDAAHGIGFLGSIVI